jgi:hypothetical protein
MIFAQRFMTAIIHIQSACLELKRSSQEFHHKKWSQYAQSVLPSRIGVFNACRVDSEVELYGKSSFLESSCPAQGEPEFFVWVSFRTEITLLKTRSSLANHL